MDIEDTMNENNKCIFNLEWKTDQNRLKEKHNHLNQAKIEVFDSLDSYIEKNKNHIVYVDINKGNDLQSSVTDKEEEWMVDELKVVEKGNTECKENIEIPDIKFYYANPVLIEGKEDNNNPLTKNNNNVGGNLNKPSSKIIFEDKLLSQSEMLICWICYRVFNTTYKLDSHLYRVHNYKKPDKKKIKSIERKENVNTDDWPPNVQKLVRRVNGTKIFFCNLCSYNVNRSDSMTKHLLRVHNDGRVVPEYQCEVCGKIFIDKGYLRNHSVSHLTERLYRCHICGRDFQRQASLKRHIQAHSDSKQFSCTLCDYQTNRKHLMYRHVELHRSGRAYLCPLCKAEFFTQLSFRSHMYSHNPSSNSCSFCKVNFSSRERMMFHMKKNHFTLDIKHETQQNDEPI